ncbi:hypothetical protein A5630_25280 [Mycolicibacterium mucogenicum]|uniref:Uncharacterized protein n=1 Tax=Mycolicibacterium mucogenicum TaxID=56689 RepID=A0A1A3GY17_MYCMU|nr:hypothetical protein [Mycolicibacterium mucogenicum]OBJ40266.1 hypothetical protein A5630_25280 [Mycolicibacterium mucogenicum]
MKTIAEIIENLKRTKEVLKERGRTTGKLVDPETGCACLLGGIGIAVVGDAFLESADAEGWIDDYSPFYPNGAARAEVLALLDVMTDDELRHLGYSRYDTNDCTVFRYNDNYAAGGELGDEKVFGLIDRAVADLEGRVAA